MRRPPWFDVGIWNSLLWKTIQHLRSKVSGPVRQPLDGVNTLKIFFSISHCLSMVELRPSSSLSTDCVVSLRGDWAIFCHAGSGRVGRVWSAREKSLEILKPWLGIEPGPRGGQTVSYPTELSWLTEDLTMKIWIESKRKLFISQQNRGHFLNDPL